MDVKDLGIESLELRLPCARESLDHLAQTKVRAMLYRLSLVSRLAVSKRKLLQQQVVG